MDIPAIIFDQRNLAIQLSRFVGSEVALAGGLFIAENSPYLVERQLVTQAVLKRRTEFFSGRHFAREALREIGCAELPILRGEKGNPVWPPGVLGSISHDEGYAVAAVTSSRNLTGFGIDLLLDSARVEPELQYLIARPEELSELAYTYKNISALALVFSVKESVVKAVSPTINKYLDLLEINISIKDGEIRAHLPEFDFQLRCGAISLQGGLFTFAIMEEKK